MKIYKTNYREVPKKVYQYADTIMDTAYTTVWMMNRKQIIDFILNDCDDLSLEELEKDDDELLRTLATFAIAKNTWWSGWYSDLDIIPDSLKAYFIHWGEGLECDDCGDTPEEELLKQEYINLTKNTI
jgi:hypothetical protein